MSTSSLTSLPPSDFRSAPSSDTLDLAPPKPAPKRTYGRARRLSPSPPLLGASSSSSMPSYIAPPLATTSPSKALLDRWSSANQSWRDELSKLDAPSFDKVEELPDDDGEAIKREMEKMRRQARAMKALQGQHSTLPFKDNRNLDVPTNALGKTSSLTSIPTTATSPLRSSPPPLRSSSPPVDNRRLQASSSEVAEETMFPVRKSGMSGRPKKIIISDDEEDEDEDEAPLFAKDTSRSASPVDESTTERGSSPPPNRNHDREDEDEEDNENIRDYLDNLADQQAIVDKKRAEEESRQPKSSALEGLDDLFDDEEDEPREKRGRKPKGLNKADRAEMEKDIARAQRERPVAFSRPEPSRLPITAWLAQANVAVKSKEPIDHKNAVPGLTFAKSPQTSPGQPTPPDDDIIGFTPSSGLRHPLGTTSTSRISIENPNTPTPAPGKKDKGKYKVVVPGTSEGPEPEEDDQDFSTFMDKQEIRDKEKTDRDAKRKKLLEFKQNMVKQQIAKLNLEPSKPSSSDYEHEQDESEDDDLEFDDDEPTPKREVGKQALPKVTGAKAVLAKDVNQSTISKQKQGFLARAGKLHKKVKPQNQDQSDISETYVDFAAKTFSHAQQKQLNGGAKPANQKKGREDPLSNEDMAKLIQRKHQEQIVKLRQKKEEDYGRVKVLPQRVEQDFQVLLEASKNEHENESDKDGDDEEDGEDGDYNPEEEMVWSGEEQEGEEGEGDIENQSQPEEEGEGEHQNEDQHALPATLEEDDDEESTPMIKRKPRASARVAFDSDDEDAPTQAQARIRSSPAQKAPLAEMAAGLTATAKSTQEFGGFDLGGFGDDAGSQGFSQLFGDTQAATQAGEEDAFAALRADHVGFLPSDAMLPGVQISKTQVERDNNLIAAEIEEAAMERMQEVEKPKKQYINERGLFTQTRPVYEEDTQVSNTRRQLGGLSDFSIGATPFGKTQTQTMESPNEIGSPTQTQTQTQGDDKSFTRLRRRLSGPNDAQEPLTLSPTQPARTERTVFDRMMKASSRAERQEQRKLMRKSRMVDEQAEESDEDNGWAKIGGAEENDDDDDDEENDGFLEELVDDQEVDEEVRKRQDELAAEKNREIQAADDARIEAEARKITEGEYRYKKRGKDFVDGEESDEDERGGKRRKLSRKERRKRKLDREDGLDKLHGEANVFRQVYEDDLGSDEDEVDETPLESYNLNLNFVVDEPEEVSQVAVEPKRTFREKLDMLKNRGVMNRGMNYEEMAIDDADEDEIALDPRATALKKRRDTFIGEDEDHPMGDEGFSISRSIRNTTSVVSTSDHKQNNTRKLASYASYVQEESQVNRRVGGGAAGVSVVRPQNSSRSIGPSRSSSLNNGRPAPVPHPHRQSTGGSHGSASGSGSVLLSKGNKFA